MMVLRQVIHSLLPIARSKGPSKDGEGNQGSPKLDWEHVSDSGPIFGDIGGGKMPTSQSLHHLSSMLRQ